MGQARYVVRRQSKDGFEDHSLPRWDGIGTMRRETAVKGWMDSAVTHFLDGMRQARYIVRQQ